MSVFLFPQNLKASAKLWLWSLHDFVLLCIGVLLSAIATVQMGWLLPGALTLCFGFLAIRLEDTTVLDFITYAVRFLVTGQQYYEWR